MKSSSTPILLPTKLVYAALIALASSACLNLLSLGVRVTTLYETNTISRTKHPTSIPLRIQPAAYVFNDTSDHYGLDQPEDWISIIPKGHGFVDVAGSIYQLSAFHEIHCLMGWRQYYSNIFAGGELEEHSYRHNEHCASHMTQLKLCSADMTLEPTKTKISERSGRRVHVVTEDGITHVCRDWIQLRDWMEANFELWGKDARHYEGDRLN